MSEKIVVPVLGESITEATVSKWLKSEGETVEADEPIVELETDKVNLEVPSPISGVLSQINSKDGTVVEAGALLGSVSENGSGSTKKEETKNICVKYIIHQNTYYCSFVNDIVIIFVCVMTTIVVSNHILIFSFWAIHK